MANVGIVAYGSRGDVQPMAALAIGLEKSGHRAKLLVCSNFRNWLEGLGLEVVCPDFDYQQLHNTETAYRLWEAGGDHSTMAKLAAEWEAQIGFSPYEAMVDFASDLDVMVSAYSQMACAAVAEKLRIPMAAAYVFPCAAVKEDADGNPELVPSSFPGVDYYNSLRREVLGLGPVTESQMHQVFSRTPTLHAYSRHVGVHPPGWPEHFHTVGYCFLDPSADWTPPADLASFVENGDPPVVIGFGSMTARDAADFTDMVVGAVQDAGRRAVLLSGWAGLGKTDALPPDVFCADDVPHQWLLPRAAAVVNHGGCGSVAAGLRAGLPTVVVPFSFDQFFWGQRVAALGVGPEPLARNTLEREPLARAIEQATSDEQMRRQAQRTAELIAEEDGVGRAVQLIEELVGQH